MGRLVNPKRAVETVWGPGQQLLASIHTCPQIYDLERSFHAATAISLLDHFLDFLDGNGAVIADVPLAICYSSLLHPRRGDHP